MAEERERSGGKTDYVWGRHDKHRNMINSTQPHPDPSAHRLPSIATLRFNPCRDHLYLLVSRFRSLSLSRARATGTRSTTVIFHRSIFPSYISYPVFVRRRRGNRSFQKKKKKGNRPISLLLPSTPRVGKLARRDSRLSVGEGRGPTTSFLINDFKARVSFRFEHAIESKDKRKERDGHDGTGHEAKTLLINSADPLSFQDIPWQAYN